MALYFLSYDLRKVRSYQPLYDELERFGGVRALESVWCFQHTGSNCVALRDHFVQFVDLDDGLIVIETSSWAGTRLNAQLPITW